MNLKKIGLFALAMIMTLFSFQTHSFAAEEMEWVKKAPMPTARYNHAGLIYNDKIYIHGGTEGNNSLSDLEMYDPELDTWYKLPSSSIGRSVGTFVEHQGKFYAIGGRVSNADTNIVEEYDPITNSWSRKQSMPQALKNVKSVSLENNIYVFGNTTTVYVFNPETNNWITKNPLPFKSDPIYFNFSVLDNTIYATEYSPSGDAPKIYSYDHIKDTWTFVDDAPSGIVLTPRMIYDEKLFIIGIDSTEIKYYDLNSKELITHPVSITPLKRSAFMGIVSGKLYAIGGTYIVNGHTSGATPDVEELNLSELINPDPNPDPNPEPNPDPNPNPTGNALLVIYMDSGLIKEFEMTNEEIRNFTEWYEGRARGNGKEAYIVNKKYNIGPFNSRKDFISYSHIESFEVQEYSR
ncbi:galactose oxidase [Brevibacillus laterosporus]|uniref:Kelch repeat-containing protein n=1 Tax=Brevibacillus laterosporus TaxID=1465 RepID=UPI000374FDB6|nr:kelch repeat-containing protein [Brevibacillus laterosporus]ATO49855.1 galactose oxidase [Brevibacillus laterosporus DSM 25]MBG9802539.1 galactose oxidase [Brevibacillus laterosporus]MCR8938090.1 galactose oxidase [Brevibacillus laterosporus]MCZ0840730.1 galactose oxidase [Brevibacillus laterosporus]MCZ0847410.1 galactose oxidase [Brevibacillus laterosporus]